MKKPAIMVTGSTGFIGGALTAALVATDERTIVLPVRQKHTVERARAAIVAELAAMGRKADEGLLQRLVFLPLPRTAVLLERLVADLVPQLAPFEVSDIVHCAGSLSYFNTVRLQEGNQALTGAFLDVGHAIGIERFTYVSTAFSSGYVAGRIPERLHPEPAEEANEYTRSKRHTEALVASSGLRYLIVRPSIVLGHSQSGFYQGPPYGAYQVWTGLSKFMCDRYRRVIHAVAPALPLNFVHQDALQAGFMAAFQSSLNDSIVHLVSRDDVTTREYWHLWMERCGRPEEVVYYDSLAELDRDSLDPGERLVIDFAEANIEISSRRWDFDTGTLDAFRAGGLRFVDASVATLGACLDRFLVTSARSAAYLSTLAPPDVRPQALEAVNRRARVQLPA